MANIDIDYLNKIATRFRGFKKPNDIQKLIILLSEKSNRDSEDNKKLAVLIKAQKSADQLFKARKAANDVINAENVMKKKLETRKKIIWGSLLLKIAKTDINMSQTLVSLYESGYMSDSDQEVVKIEYEAAKLQVIRQNREY